MSNRFKVEKLRNSDEYTALSIGDYNESLGALLANGFKPVSVEKLAEHRIDLGLYHQISWTGTRTTDLFVYANDKYYLAHGRTDSILFDPDALALIQEYHANWKEIKARREFIGDIIEIPREGVTIPLAQFKDHPVTQFLFGDQIEGYSEWLKEAEIPAFPVLPPSYSITQHYPEGFIRPLIIRCTDNWSGIITANADLHTDYGYRGWANKYDGELNPVETFTSQQLALVKRFFPLEDRTYSLSELEYLFYNSPFRTLFNPVLRTVRNGGSLLPANFDTWS